jgi:biotin operon repressor
MSPTTAEADREALLRRQVEIAEEHLLWLRAAAIPRVRETIEAVLVKEQQRRAFELCDGTRTGPEIASAVGVTRQSISTWTQNWRNLGIAVQVGERKVRHLISLDALEVPLKPRPK